MKNSIIYQTATFRMGSIFGNPSYQQMSQNTGTTTSGIITANDTSLTFMFFAASPQAYNANPADFYLDNIIIEEVTEVACSDAEIQAYNLQNGKYRYGFNGQERDYEVNQAGNVNTAMFWEYDARLGRRWNVDPIEKVWQSPYATFSNNPITNIDPNGDDDHFSMKNGKLTLSQTKNGTTIYIHTEGQVYKLSQLPLTTQENRKLAVKVFAYYASKMGHINAQVGLKDNKEDPSSHNPAFTAASTVKEGELSIFLNTNGGINSRLDNYNNLKSVIKHEKKHYDDKDPTKNEYSYYEHSKVYLEQFKDVSFSKTDIDFKVSQTAAYFAYIISAVKNGDIGRTDVQDIINNYNKLNTGISVSTTTPYLGSKDFSFDLTYKKNGKTVNGSIDIKQAPKTPH